jgi:hypothetical protein
MNRTTVAAGLIALGAILAAPALAAGPAHAAALPSDPDGFWLGPNGPNGPGYGWPYGGNGATDGGKPFDLGDTGRGLTGGLPGGSMIGDLF